MSPVSRILSEKRILIHGSSRPRFESLVNAMAEGAGTAQARSLGQPTIDSEDSKLRFLFAEDLASAVGVLSTRYVHLVVVDVSDTEDVEARCSTVRRFVESLDAESDRELRYGFHRIVILLPDESTPLHDDLLLELGRCGIRHVHRVGPIGDAGSTASYGALHARIARLVDVRDLGKTAIVANGGGITGIYFELGALKCLDDCLGRGSTNEFDAYYGISSGAVVTSMLAVGYSVDEIMASLAGHPGGRIPPLGLSVWRFAHLNLADVVWRFRRFATSGAKAIAKSAWNRKVAADDLFLEWTHLVAAPFQSSGFEKMIRGVLDVPHGTNRFTDLTRPLYVGATDQDARRPVLFGAGAFRDVPISRAVQASLSITPAFGGVDIDGRYYEDGAVTQTSNLVDAVDHGARLVFVIDPFVPYVSRTPGANDRRGMLYNLDQDVRTLSFTRFEKVREALLRDRPDVSSFTVLPANSQRKLLSTNPMDHRPYLAIWRAAYLSTLQRLQQIEHRLAGDLAARGKALDLSRATEVARQLRRRGRIGFEDFFPGRKVEIVRRPLVREPVAVESETLEQAAT